MKALHSNDYNDNYYNYNINIDGGPRYKPPEVSRGSPVLHCSLTTITTIVYYDMCNLINSCSYCSSSTIKKTV